MKDQYIAKLEEELAYLKEHQKLTTYIQGRIHGLESAIEIIKKTYNEL